MNKYLRTFFLLTVYTVLFASIAEAELNTGRAFNSDLDALISQSDQIKTSDSAQFKQNLIKLESYLDSASPQQQEFINYLQAYENVLDGDFENAQVDLENLFLNATSLHSKIRIKATLANIQAISREYGKSLVNLDFAINNVEEIGDEILTNKINLVSSIVYFLLEIYDMSSKYAELVVNANPDAVMVCKASVYNFRSRIKLNLAIDDQLMNDAIELCKNNNEIIYASLLELDWIHAKLDHAYLEQNNELIETLLKKVKSLESGVDKFGYNNLIGLKDMVLAKAYYYNGQVDLALKSANKSIAGSTRSGNTSQVVDALRILQQEVLIHDDYKRAYQFGNQINLVEREIYSEAKSKQMAYMTVKHTNLSKTLEIEQLNQQKAVLELEKKLANQEANNQRLVILLILMLLALLLMWLLRIKKRHDYFRNVSEIDHLTKVLTRKAFEEQASVLIQRMASEEKQVHMAIMDFDHFKQVNDNNGHLVGDWVLKHVIYACKQQVEGEMIIARLGGEEFCIVMPEMDFNAMSTKVEEFRIAVESLDCSESGADFSITASFGVSSSATSGYSMNLLLTHADVALFEAKRQGRNQVVIFNSSQPL